MTPPLDPANRQRLQKFRKLATDLRAGQDFPITRLTPIKSLCQDPAVAAAFTQYLASLAAETLATRPRPRHLTKDRWQNFQRLASEGMAALTGRGSASELRTILVDVRSSQYEIRKVSWTSVRTIECEELLQIEQALRCRIGEGEPSRIAYESARNHAEEYDPSYGTGLLPQSALALEQIIAFWGDA